MSDGLMLYLDDDGVARHYDDTYDITIHCESEEERENAIELIKSRQWTPCSKSLPKKDGDYYVTTHGGQIARYIYIKGASDEYWMRCATAWMPLPEPYKED